ncbi:MAG: hypothetical protein V2A69_12945 [Pseudomonadota bacterium]
MGNILFESIRVVGRTALNQILGSEQGKSEKEKGKSDTTGTFEEDARLTALFLWTLQSTNGEGKSEKEKGKSEEVEEEEEEIEDDEEDAAPKVKAKGYSLIFDVVRRFAQPLGIGLPKWEGRIIETKKGVVRLLSVSERSRQLFGQNGARSVDENDFAAKVASRASWLPGFTPAAALPRIRSRGKKRLVVAGEAELTAHEGITTLDRVHAAMLLQANGRANALRALLKAEQERGQDFLRLANALSALYPKEGEEKRLLDAMLLAVPR